MFTEKTWPSSAAFCAGCCRTVLRAGFAAGQDDIVEDTKCEDSRRNLMRFFFRSVRFNVVVVALVLSAAAQVERAAWLRYAVLDGKAAKAYERLPGRVVVLGDGVVLKNAAQELSRGIEQMLGRSIGTSAEVSGDAIVLGTLAQVRAAAKMRPAQELTGDGYWITRAKIHGHRCIVIAGADERGVLYGVFGLWGRIARGESIPANEVQQPSAPIRWVNQWDNLDGRIERGYGGPSIFFADGKVRDDLTRAGEYARLLASVGINGCTVNNVNADAADARRRSFLPQVRADCGGVSSVGRPAFAFGGSEQPEDCWRAGYVRSAGSESCGVVAARKSTKSTARFRISAGSW